MTVVVWAREPRGDRGQFVVETRDARAQRRHQRGRQCAAYGHAVEHPLLVEAAHDDQPVDGIDASVPRLAQHKLAAAVPADRRNAQVDLGGELAIDVDLGRAHGRPSPHGREIHVRELHGALQLVGAVARQEDHGAVRVDATRRRQPGREKGGDLRLILDDEGRVRAHGLRRSPRAVPRRRRDRREG